MSEGAGPLKRMRILAAETATSRVEAEIRKALSVLEERRSTINTDRVTWIR